MNSAIQAVGRLFYQTMSGDSQLQQMLPGGIHDGMVADLETNPYPLVCIAERLETPSNDLSRVARTVAVRIQIWSRYRGGREAAAIAERILDLFDQVHGAALDGWVMNQCDLELNDELVEGPDLRQRNIRFRVRCQVETA